MNYIKPNNESIAEFDRCGTIKEIILWHRKYTPWIPDSCIFTVYIPKYLEQGKTIKDTEESIPAPSVAQQYEAMMKLQEKLSEEKKHQDQRKEELKKQYNLPEKTQDSEDKEAMEELKKYKDALNPKKQLDHLNTLKSKLDNYISEAKKALDIIEIEIKGVSGNLSEFSKPTDDILITTTH